MLNDWMFSLYGPTYLGWVVKKYDKDMKMFNKWSTEELIQEVFLQDADPSIIIMWLKKNVGNIYDTFSLGSDPYYHLRKKYEIEWAKSGNQKLKLAVCLYGKSRLALREIFFSEDAEFIKEAILKNHSFAADIGLRQLSRAHAASIWVVASRPFR